MELIPVDVDEIPAGRTGDTVTQGFLQSFLDSGHEGAQVTLHEGEKVDGVRARLIASIDKNDFPIRVVSKTVGEGDDKETRLYVKRDDSVLPEIAKRKSDRKAAQERAKAERKAAKANGAAQVTETTEVAEPVVEAEVAPVEVEQETVKSGRRGR